MGGPKLLHAGLKHSDGTWALFGSHFAPKINITFFWHKLDAKYFHVKQFLVKSVLSEDTLKNCFGEAQVLKCIPFLKPQKHLKK